MKMKTNGLVRIAVPVTVLVAAAIGVKSCAPAKPAASLPAKSAGVLQELTPDDLRTLGIEGDTPQDTLKTLVGRLQSVTQRQEQLESQNKTLAEENKALKSQNQNVDGRISQAVSNAQSASNKAQGQLRDQVGALNARMNALLQELQEKGRNDGGLSDGAAGPGSDIPVGLGFDGGEGSSVPRAGNDGLLWVEPKDGIAVDASGKPVGEGARGATGFSFASAFSGDNAVSQQKTELMRKAGNGQELSGNAAAGGPVTPVYTLPENSTLIGSRAMTALLGRVPIDGKVTDPYPFKVLIGKENLTANGIDLPEVQGAIVSGTATGDWTLSCVRGEVNSITFVFEDGTVRTLPRPVNQSEGNNSRNTSTIGWLSDENGIPCLSGERKSNASTYLPTLFALSSAGAASDALAENQRTKTVDGGDVTSTLTGDAGKAVLGSALSGGMKETADWVKARYGQTFDAVYVPPGQKVAVHITRQLAIDYEETGRKVKYDDFSLSYAGSGMD